MSKSLVHYNVLLIANSPFTGGYILFPSLQFSFLTTYNNSEKNDICFHFQVLAVQRTTSTVEFMNFNGTVLEKEYSQATKKNSTLLGFVWSQQNEVALITDHGIELYTIIPEKRSLRHLKTTSATIQWFVWCAKNNIALLASSHGSHLQPVVFKAGAFNKLPKLESNKIVTQNRTVLLTIMPAVFQRNPAA